MKWKKPRAWSDPDGCSSTIVLYDPRGRDGLPESEGIFVHTNMGWIAVSVGDGSESASELALKLAESYKLKEMNKERAVWACGFEGEEDKFED